MITQLPQPPVRSSIADKPDLTVNSDWFRWLSQTLLATLQKCSQIAASLLKDSQSGVLASTRILTVTQTGIYRIAWYEQITQAATTSSSLKATITYTSKGQVQTLTDPVALTGNSLTTQQSGSALVTIDGGTSVLVSTAYTSVGATPMHYTLAVSVELVQ